MSIWEFNVFVFYYNLLIVKILKTSKKYGYTILTRW